MKNPEKITERFSQTIIRTVVTTTLITLILSFADVFPNHSMSKPAAFGIIWLMIFCIVFGGHWPELFFINRIKFALPQNMLLLYITKIIYWFLSSIPLFILADWVGNSLTNGGIRLGQWQVFGFFYIGIQLILQTIMQLRWRKNCYNGVY